jgi:hypothetical protein
MGFIGKYLLSGLLEEISLERLETVKTSGAYCTETAQIEEPRQGQLHYQYYELFDYLLAFPYSTVWIWWGWKMVVEISHPGVFAWQGPGLYFQRLIKPFG